MSTEPSNSQATAVDADRGQTVAVPLEVATGEVAVLVERQPGGELQPLELVEVGAAVVLLEHVDDRQPGLDRRLQAAAQRALAGAGRSIDQENVRPSHD